VSGVRFQQLKNHKYQITNTKWFDKPFDRLTVLSEVEGLTTLSLVEGQITMTEIQNSKRRNSIDFNRKDKAKRYHKSSIFNRQYSIPVYPV
jgi:hypothetical protein